MLSEAVWLLGFSNAVEHKVLPHRQRNSRGRKKKDTSHQVPTEANVQHPGAVLGSGSLSKDFRTKSPRSPLATESLFPLRSCLNDSRSTKSLAFSLCRIGTVSQCCKDVNLSVGSSRFNTKPCSPRRAVHILGRMWKAGIAFVKTVPLFS